MALFGKAKLSMVSCVSMTLYVSNDILSMNTVLIKHFFSKRSTLLNYFYHRTCIILTHTKEQKFRQFEHERESENISHFTSSTKTYHQGPQEKQSFNH